MSQASDASALDQAESKSDNDLSDSDTWMFKRVRRLNKRVHMWKNCSLDECQAKATDFERRLAALVNEDEVNTVHLRSLLYDGAAALSPPQAKR